MAARLGRRVDKTIRTHRIACLGMYIGAPVVLSNVRSAQFNLYTSKSLPVKGFRERLQKKTSESSRDRHITRKDTTPTMSSIQGLPPTFSEKRIRLRLDQIKLATQQIQRDINTPPSRTVPPLLLLMYKSYQREYAALRQELEREIDPILKQIRLRIQQMEAGDTHKRHCVLDKVEAVGGVKARALCSDLIGIRDRDWYRAPSGKGSRRRPRSLWLPKRRMFPNM